MAIKCDIASLTSIAEALLAGQAESNRYLTLKIQEQKAAGRVDDEVDNDDNENGDNDEKVEADQDDTKADDDANDDTTAKKGKAKAKGKSKGRKKVTTLSLLLFCCNPPNPYRIFQIQGPPKKKAKSAKGSKTNNNDANDEAADVDTAET
jgi:hypothetical protein